MIAKDVMTPDPVTLTARATIEEAQDLVRERGIRHVPVVDQRGALIGMLSDRDLGYLDVGRLVGEPEPAVRQRLATPVGQVMTRDPVSVGPEAGLDEVVELLIEGRFGAVPVVETGSLRVVGIVSYVDVLRAVQDLLEG